jgi:chemotaxis signal transduction protein
MFRDGAARLLVFRVGAERFAVALDAVEEVIDAPAVQPLPDAPPNVLGVAAIRGELVPMYDPRSVLRVAGSVDGAALLFGRGGRRLGLAIDDVYDAITLAEDELLSAPGVEAADGILRGVTRRGDSLVAVLDADALLHAVSAVRSEVS